MGSRDQCGLGLIPRLGICVLEFVVGSRPCSERFFSRYSGFPLSSKTNIFKFQFHLESVVFDHLVMELCTIYKFRFFFTCTFKEFLYFSLKISEK